MGSIRLICSLIGVLVLLWKSPGFSAASRINVALSGTAIQSSTSSGGLAEHSIDGNNDPQWEHNSCSCTAGQARAWWRLELPGVYRVSEIEVTNRNSNRWRLNNVEILIGDSLSNNGNDNPRCAIINDDPGCLTQTVKCWGMEGRFINLYRSSDAPESLQFCEVKVYGALPNCAASVAKTKAHRERTLASGHKPQGA
ncbi:unnamed protein product [Gadus morhua 'NCC']